MNSGIYALYNEVSGKAYIGQTRNLNRRKYDHFRSLQKGTHHNKYLQRAYNHDGEKAFAFIVLEECAVDVLDEHERYWITQLQTMDATLGYNLESGGNVGKDVSESVRSAKRGANNPMFGKRLSADRIEALRIRNRCHGSKLTEETVKQIKIDLLRRMPVKAVADKYGTSSAIITKIKTGKNFYWVRQELNSLIAESARREERDKKIFEMAGMGLSRHKIAVALGIDAATVARALKTPSDYFRKSETKQTLKGKVVADYLAGMNREDIKNKYALTDSVYVGMISDAYNNRKNEIKKKAISMRLSGMQVKDIAKQLGFARTTISHWTKEAVKQTP